MIEFLESIKTEVFKHRPVLKEIADRHSGESLYEYIKSGWQVPNVAPDPLFLDCLESALTEVYGTEISEQARHQLEAKPLVSTIDHHGIWGHPFFVNSALIYSLYFEPNELVLTLGTESVSLNNITSWSGCLMWHNNDLAFKRRSFFPDRLKTLPVFSAPPIGEKAVQKVLAKLPAKGIIEAMAFNQAYGFPNFSSQACVLSHNLWRKVFPSAPALVYFPLERLVSMYLLKIFKDPGHALTKLVLSKEGRKLWQKYFSNEHTFLFWGIDGKGRRVRLDKLDGAGSELIKKIKTGQIYPSSPLCFAALLCAGLACAGGFNQTTWLTRVKGQLADLFEEMGKTSPDISGVPTKNFAESSLAWLSGGQVGYFQPTAIDLYLSGKDYYPIFSRFAQKLKLGQSLDLAMPTIYSVVVPAEERVPGFNIQAREKEVFESLGIGHIYKDLLTDGLN